MVHFLTFQNKCVGMLLVTVFSEADQESLTTTLNYTTSESDIDLGDFFRFLHFYTELLPMQLPWVSGWLASTVSMIYFSF